MGARRTGSGKPPRGPRRPPGAVAETRALEVRNYRDGHPADEAVIDIETVFATDCSTLADQAALLDRLFGVEIAALFERMK